MYVLGLMSGTSADGVDAALLELKGNVDRPQWKLINTASIKYPAFLQKKIIDVGQGQALNSSEWLSLSESITEFHYSVAIKCDPDGISDLVGCHGQTVFHKPPAGSNKGGSLQIVQAPLLAILLDKTLIFDFRSKDIALGGQGAPLTPFLDVSLMPPHECWRAVLNLGGIANLTLIPPSIGPEKNSKLIGWDCGPANSLIDLAVQECSDGQFLFDCDGLIAAEGIPDLKAIDKWLNEDFFQLLPPKSTGREKFGIEDLHRRFSEIDSDDTNDLVATMTCFTASVIGQDLENIFREKNIKPIELFAAGGGSQNPTLMKQIQKKCQGIRILTTDEIGIPWQSREAMAFALLAWWNICQKPISNTVTGSKRSSVLGTVVTP